MGNTPILKMTRREDEKADIFAKLECRNLMRYLCDHCYTAQSDLGPLSDEEHSPFFAERRLFHLQQQGSPCIKYGATGDCRREDITQDRSC